MVTRTPSSLPISLTPLIKGRDMNLRMAVRPHKQLTAKVYFIATSKSYENLKYTTISPQALGHIIPETCNAVYLALKGDYIKVSK
jgi:hypothetical protein